MSFSAESSDFGDHGKGEKRGVDKAELEKVQSANDWEKANLGDDDRRKKFLRLMGAKKKEHHGRFVIGDNAAKHGRTDEETSRLNRQLEHQYRSGLDLKLSGAARHHSGLGFHDESNAPTSSALAEPCRNKDSTSDDKDAKCEQKDLNKPQDQDLNKPQDNVSSKPQDKDSNKPQEKDLKSEADQPSDSKAKVVEAEQTNGKERRSSESEKFKMNFVKASE